MTATYIQNRLPSRAVDTTPFEKWFGEKPSLKHLRVFGSVAYVHIPDVKRSKLDGKAQKLVFVGYCDDRKGYRFLDPATDRITISRDARFIELKNGSLMLDGPCEKDEELLIDAVPMQIEEEAPGGQELPTEKPSGGQQHPIEEEQVSSEEEEEFYGWDEHGEEANLDGEQRPIRSTRGVLPQRLKDFEVDVAKVVLLDPVSYEEAMGSPERSLWQAAMRDEYDSLLKNGTWSLVELPAGRSPIGCKWVYKRKEDADGNVARFKARLVAQGFSQRYGIDYDAVFAPVVTQTTLRTLLTVAGQMRMTVRHVDVKCAYLHGNLQEEIFMQQPKGFVVRGREKLVCRLKRSLYGLKQAAKVWHDTINKILTDMGFVQSKSDPCLYLKTSPDGEEIFLLIYVDDMILASRNEAEINRIELELQKKIKLSSLGAVNQFLGMRVTKDADGYFALDQHMFIKKIASRFGLADAKGSNVPLDPGYYKNRVGSKNLPDNQDYHSLVGALLYVVVNTRPDVAASVSILSRKVSEPTEADWVELKRVVRYLLKTSDYKLVLKANRKKPLELYGYSDSDWSGDVSDRKSNTGYLFRLGDATICWASRKQTSVSLSSMEAEYTALSEACKELIWIRRLLEDLNRKQEGPTVMFEDNRSCINFVEVERLSRRSKHIDTRMHFTKELVDNGTVALKYCASEEMLADVLTKPLGNVKQKKFSEAMGLVGEGVFK